MDEVIQCGLCGGEARLVTEERPVKVGKRSAVVEDQFYRCVACGEELYEPSQMDEVMKRASAAIRREAGLLQPEEILQVRSDLGITQADFERLLRVGPKTVVRWEKGTVFQNQATDVLLRAVRDFPGFAEYLASQSGVTVAVRARREVAPRPYLDFSLGPDELVQVDSYVSADSVSYKVETGGLERPAA